MKQILMTLQSLETEVDRMLSVFQAWQLIVISYWEATMVEHMFIDLKNSPASVISTIPTWKILRLSIILIMTIDRTFYFYFV